MFIPNVEKFTYPEYTDGHYLVVKNDNGIPFDKDYPYIDNSKSFRFKKWWFRIFFIVIVMPICRIRLGLKVKGRRNIKEYKDVIKGGIVSCCNHVHMWDFIGIAYGIRNYKPKFLAWAKNIRGALGGPIRLVGGIPIPDDDLGAQLAHTRSVKQFVNDGGWLHLYSEGSAWEFYHPIRPFKKGTATYAVMCDKPILPMAYSFRKPNWIRRKIFKQVGVYTLNIGTPIYKNNDLPRKQQEEDLTKRAHEAVCKLAGINPADNIYPPIFNNTKRIDY